jgi:cytochrome b561
MKKSDVWPPSLRLVHWASAALVVAALGLGTIMVQVVHDPAERFELTQTHKSVGITVLALTIVRLCLRILTDAPKPEPASRFVLLAAKIAHVSLYGLLLVMPLSGWLTVTTTPVRVPTFVFGLVELPYPLSPDLNTYWVAHAIHVVSAVFLASLVVLHVAAAIIHRFLWQDRTLARMWWTRSTAPHGTGI